jgi:hypothetical protein
VERLIARLKGWREKWLSLGGKEILLKAVIQSLLVFAMGVFKMPKNICKEFTDAMSSFWRGDDEDHKKLHWWDWWRMCIPKKEGGMGFRDLHAFNLAMLAKQCWRLLTNPQTLCARVLRAKYYPDRNLLKAGNKKGSSFTWKSIVTGIHTIVRGHIWRVRIGGRINIWDHGWVPGNPDKKVLTPRAHVLLNKVEDLIDPHSGEWDELLIRQKNYHVFFAKILDLL